MNRLVSLAAVSAIALLFMGQAPAKKVKPHLVYKVGVGGLSAGTFKGMKISSHTVLLAGPDVKVAAKMADTDQKPIVFSGGSVSNFVMKRLKPMVGQQMTVTVSVTPEGGVEPGGQRCKFTLEHAMLKKLKNDTLAFKPSEMPDFECK